MATNFTWNELYARAEIRRAKVAGTTTLKEIDRNSLDDWSIAWLNDVEDGTEFFVDGDYYAVWELRQHDESGRVMRIERAVYLDKAQDGILVCLDERMGFGLTLCDDGYDGKIADLLQKEALDCGFPLHHPRKSMTWRELRSALDAIDNEDILDMAVQVDDPLHGCFYSVSSLSPFDGEERASVDNPLSLTVHEEL